LEHLTRSWALELAPDGIRVNAVAPGPTESEVFDAAGLTAAQQDALIATQNETIPLRRRGPRDVARWIVHLAGTDADWVTGQVLTVDGGLELLGRVNVRVFLLLRPAPGDRGTRAALSGRCRAGGPDPSLPRG
jgi:NAD(P)-dependent dehydrogenase (short-subunit alcohol dehydrogenase family)